MADKYLRRDSTSGQIAETEATDVSTGAPDAGEIVALDADGLIDVSMIPSTVGSEQIILDAATGGVTASDVIYIDSSSEVAPASAAVAGNAACGFVLTSEIAGDPVTVFFEGLLTGLSGLTPGGRVYLDDATPGALTQTPVTGTGKLHQLVGKAVNATTVLFEADDSILLA